MLLFIFQCSGLGASFCYLLSYLVGKRLVIRYIPERVTEWQNHVSTYLVGKRLAIRYIPERVTE